MATENVTGMFDGFVEVVDERTSFVSRVPREWLDDPRLGRFIARTNAQLALDRELPTPPANATKKDLLAYAADAGISTEGADTKGDVLVALEPYLATSDEEPDEEPAGAPLTDGDPSTPTDAPAAGDNTTPSN